MKTTKQLFVAALLATLLTSCDSEAGDKRPQPGEQSSLAISLRPKSKQIVINVVAEGKWRLISAPKPTGPWSELEHGSGRKVLTIKIGHSVPEQYFRLVEKDRNCD